MANNQIPYVIPLTSQKPKIITLVPNDPGSRYKCRQLQVQVIGSSKMIKTVLANILDVSKDMQIPPTYIGNFFGYEIGAKAAFDEKKAVRQQAYVTGEQDVKDLSRLVEKFINEVLLCPNCGLPEIRLVPKDNDVFGQCRACGANSKLPIANDKFRRFVINHPPAYDKNKAFQGSSADATTDKKEKKEKKEKKSKKEEADEEGAEEAAETEAAVAEETDKKEKKEKKEKKSKKDKKDEEENIVWYTDTSEEAIKKRREALLPASAAAALTGKQQETDIQIAEIITSFEKLKAFKTEQNIGDEAWVKALWKTMFADKQVKTELAKHKDILTKFTRSKAGQLALLKAVESYAPTLGDQLKKQLPVILKQLYDEDVLVEEFIIQWNDKDCSDEAVKAAAAPFVTWLKEAEEDEEDDE